MALATIAMLPAAVGRAMSTLFGVANPAFFFGATGLFVLAIVMNDRRSRGRVHPVTLWGGLGLMLSFPGPASSPWCKWRAAPRRARRRDGKARQPTIPNVFEGGATPPARMHRPSNAAALAPRAASAWKDGSLAELCGVVDPLNVPAPTTAVMGTPLTPGHGLGSALILTAQLALTSGTHLGVYEISAPIGEGGMGQVYRATDTTLGRQVAIKILPDAFAGDADVSRGSNGRRRPSPR